jgi:DNA-binding GntR family transcriptional regulator
MPTPEEVERLEITPGTPVAEHIRTGYTRTNQAVRVMISIIPGDTLILEYKIPTWQSYVKWSSPHLTRTGSWI